MDDSEWVLEQNMCNDVTIPQQSNYIKYNDNSIFNTNTTKVPAIQNIKMYKPISRGAFGKVFLGYNRTNPDQMDALTIVRRSHCVQLFHSLQSIPSVYSVMEYMIGRNLKNLLKVYSYIEISMIAFYADEISLALKYLRSQGIIHQDSMLLKLDNMLLSKEGHIKLADFGLGNILTQQQDVEIPDLVLEQIRAYNNMASIHCKFSYFVQYKRISRSRKNYRTMLLFKAIKSCKKSLVMQLLKSGVHIKTLTPCCIRHVVKDCFHSLLMANAIYGNSEITRMLIHAGCHLNTANIWGCTALHFALDFHNHGIAAELIRSGANVHLKTVAGGTALHQAIVCSTHIDHMEKIFRKNTYINCIMKYAMQHLRFTFRVRIGNTSQHLYKSGGKRRVCLYLVKMLLDSGAEVDSKDNYGCSAIHYAAFTGSLELMKILIEAGADINSQNNIGATALHNAALFDDEAMVLLLLNSGADITIKTQKGNSALHWASALTDNGCYLTVVRKLLEHGGEINEKNADDVTILNLTCDPFSVILLHVGEVEARTQKMVFDEYNLTQINKFNWLKKFYRELQAELAAMRNNKIENTEISFLSVLIEPLEEVACWARNKEFVKNFEASDYQTAYPKYAPRLREKIVAATGHKRKSVKWSSVAVFNLH